MLAWGRAAAAAGAWRAAGPSLGHVTRLSSPSPLLCARPLFTATAITYHKKARVLEVEMVDDDADGKKETHRWSAELLRIASPSIETRAWHALRGATAGDGGRNDAAAPAAAPGHVPVGRRGVGIIKLEPVGNNYAVRLTFDDLHASGLYTWDYLRRLSLRRRAVAREYLRALGARGAGRRPAAGGALRVGALRGGAPEGSGVRGAR